jgi:hypothetical protein
VRATKQNSDKNQTGRGGIGKRSRGKLWSKLPFENCSFDLVAYNVLIDVEDVARRRVGASVAAASALGGRSAPEAQPWCGCYGYMLGRVPRAL